ncbi:MAG: ferredoxin [Chloroflexota bacterium]|nr:MAG: ferredoxin [Chloroflexota bacterium]
MIYNYGYQDGMGEFYITIDGERCTGCEQCVAACARHVLEMWADDYDNFIVRVTDKEKRRISYTCSACTPDATQQRRPCHIACVPAALTHSW